MTLPWTDNATQYLTSARSKLAMTDIECERVKKWAQRLAIRDGADTIRSVPVAEAVVVMLQRRKREPAAPTPTELTPIGEQYVIPGCERAKDRGPAQFDLF
jgi:hypothetical protein